MVLKIQLHRQFVVFAGVVPKSVGIYKLFNSKRKNKKEVNSATFRKEIPELHNQVCFYNIRGYAVFYSCKLFEMLNIYSKCVFV